MNYTNLIKDAWRFIWRWKSMPALSFISMSASVLAYLAFYAIFAGVFLGVPALMERFMDIPADVLADWPASRWGLPVAAVGLVLWPIIWLVGLGARGGMIHMVDEAEDGRSVTFGGALGRGLHLSPRLAAMSFLLHLPAIVLTIISQLLVLMMIPNIINLPPEEIATTFAAFYALSICLSCFTYGLLLFLQFIYALAYRAIVIEDRGAVGAIRHGWQLLRRRAGDLIPLALIFIGLAILLVIIWYVAFFALYIALVVSAVFNDMQEPSALVIMAFVIGVLGFMLVSLVVGAIQSAWRSAAFTMAYRNWIGEAASEPAPPMPPEPELI